MRVDGSRRGKREFASDRLNTWSRRWTGVNFTGSLPRGRADRVCSSSVLPESPGDRRESVARSATAGRAEREAVPPKGYGWFVTRYDRWNPLHGSTLRGSTPRLPGQLFRDTPASPAASAASSIAVRAPDASGASASSTAQISPLPIQKSIDMERNSLQGM